MESVRPKVIVVADDDLRAELVHQLVGHGFALEALSAAEDALSYVEAHAPHVVVVGLDQGGVGALDLTERLRRLSGRNTSFIVIGRAGQPSAFAEALRRGADHCLEWPTHADALQVVVQRALE